jgi:glycosyltransferase involved in cell wall biosynthesis
MIIVSVIMITYAHEKYIRQAIEGVLMQDINFEVELIIADDNSPDNTEQVVLDIASSHPNGKWIKYTKHNKNKGMMPNFIWTLEQCKGKYIAMCEGDDYWTDPNKLQKQVDFLEANPDYVLSFHKVKILKTNGDLVEDFITKVPENYETIEMLALYGNYIHTPSVVFRNLLNRFPDSYNQSPIGDFFLYMLLAQHGKIKMLDDNMAIYRYGVGFHSTQNNQYQIESFIKTLELIKGCIVSRVIKDIIELRINNLRLDTLPHFFKRHTTFFNILSVKILKNHISFKQLSYMILIKLFRF